MSEMVGILSEKGSLIGKLELSSYIGTVYAKLSIDENTSELIITCRKEEDGGMEKADFQIDENGCLILTI